MPADNCYVNREPGTGSGLRWRRVACGRAPDQARGGPPLSSAGSEASEMGLDQSAGVAEVARDTPDRWPLSPAAARLPPRVLPQRALTMPNLQRPEHRGTVQSLTYRRVANADHTHQLALGAQSLPAVMRPTGQRQGRLARFSASLLRGTRVKDMAPNPRTIATPRKDSPAWFEAGRSQRRRGGRQRVEWPTAVTCGCDRRERDGLLRFERCGGPHPVVTEAVAVADRREHSRCQRRSARVAPISRLPSGASQNRDRMVSGPGGSLGQRGN